MKPVAHTEVIHEHRDQAHRIVKIAGGEIERGEWVADNTLATLGKLYANLDTNSCLPVGVFTVQSVAHRILD